MTARTRTQIFSAAARVLLSAVLGGLFGVLVFGPTATHIVRGLVMGGLISAPIIAGNHLFDMRSGPLSLRDAPLGLALLVRSVTYALAALGGIAAGLHWVPGLPGDHSLERPLSLLWIFVFALGLSVGFHFVRMVARLIGSVQLAHFVVGRYSRPRIEERVFMFLDLEASTAHAERLGPLEFHRLLSCFFDDIADPIAESGGEIYKYVGDEVIVTWLPADARRDAACLRCCLAIEDTIARLAPQYQRRFGMVPSFRAGLHVGPVVSGEMGLLKREIAYLGDTMNTAARLEQACREKQRRLLVSGLLLDGMTLPPGLRSVSLGTIKLRGKSEEVPAHAIERAAPSASQAG